MSTEPPCPDCEFEAIRAPSGAFVRWALFEPCGTHYDPARHAHLTTDSAPRT